MPFICPSLQNVVDGRSRGLHVGTNGRYRPALGMELDHRSAALIAIGDLPIRGKASCGNRWWWSRSEHVLNRVMRGASAKAHIADSGNFMWAKIRVLGLKINNQLTHIRREVACGPR